MSSKEGTWVKNHLVLRLLHRIKLRRTVHYSYLLLLLLLLLLATLLDIVPTERALIRHGLMVAWWKLEWSSSH